MSRSSLKKNYFIIILALFFSFGMLASPKDKQSDKNKKLREVILSAYQSGGELGLLGFQKKKNSQITDKFVLDFAEAGIDESKEEWLKVAILLARQIKNEKVLADILYKSGEYFSFISDDIDNKKAEGYLDKALSIYLKLNDPVKLGNVYEGKGNIYLNTGNNSKALEMYDKALHYYKKVGDPFSLGNLYENKGNVYFNTGDNSKALEMYDKALPCYEKAGYPDSQGNAYESKGDIFFYNGDDSRALEMYDKALSCYEKTGDLIGKGNVYLGKGVIFFYSGEDSRALEMYDKALPCYEEAGELMGQGSVFLRKGDIFFYTDEDSKALEMYNNALYFYEKAEALSSQGNVYVSKGDIHSKNGYNSKAHEMYKKALISYEKAGDQMGQELVCRRKGDFVSKIDKNSNTFGKQVNDDKYKKIRKEILAAYKLGGEKGLRTFLRKRNEKITDTFISDFAENGFKERKVEWLRISLIAAEEKNDKHILTTLYTKMAKYYSFISDFEKAGYFLDKALPIYIKSNDLLGQGYIYWRKGEIFFYTGDNYSALEMYDKALTFFKKGRSDIGQGNIYLKKGEFYAFKGENSKSLEMFNKAGFFLRKSSNMWGQGSVHFGKGTVYSSTSSYSKALKMFDKALYFYEKEEDCLGQGNIYRVKGNIYLNKGDNSAALEMLKKALAFYGKARNPIGQANVYRNIGAIYFLTDNLSGALEMYEKSLTIYKEAGDPVSQSYVNCDKGNIYLKRGQYFKALEMYDRALPVFQNVEDSEGEISALYGKAWILAKQGKIEKSLTLFEKCTASLEKVRKHTPLPEMKMNYMKSVYGQYEETVLFMLENDYDEKGLRYAEKMRAQVFLERLAAGLEKVSKGISPELRKRRDELVFKLAARKKEISDESKRKNKNQRKLEKLKKELNEIGIELDDLYLEILRENPQYASLYREPVSLINLQQNILKNEELLLEYFVSDEGVYLFLISREDFKAEKLKVPINTIDDSLNKYLETILKSSFQKGKSYRLEKKMIDSLGDLYSFLIKPVEKKIAGKKLIFAPDGQLAKIPFEALVIGMDKKTGKPVFLLEKNPVKYIQSASALAFLRSQGKAEVINHNLVAFGDPVYDYVNFKMGKPEKGSWLRSMEEMDEIKDFYRSRYIQAGGPLDRLNGSSEEVKAIAGFFEKKGQKPVLYLRDKATEKNAKLPEMNRFGYIHFACHGAAGDEFQSLVLSQDPDATEDGFFSFDEIMNCDYNAQLVVLSACETNLGKMIRGEGVIGLTRAVMYAGTPTVVASLWKVKDTATKELMVLFYKNLLEKHMNKTEALRQAKLSLLKTKKYSSPRCWSAFVMYGE